MWKQSVLAGPKPGCERRRVGLEATTPPNKDLLDTISTAKEIASPGRMSEADHANGFMTAGYQYREDVSSSIADSLTPKRRRRVGIRNMRRLAQAIREMNNYNLAIMGIAEARWTGAGKKGLNSG